MRFSRTGHAPKHRPPRLAFAVLLTVALHVDPLAAQAPDSASAALWTTRLVTLGGTAEDRLRTSQLLGRSETSGFLIRSPSTLSRSADRGGLAVELVLPELRMVHNSGHPLSLNDGALWAGRGLSAAASLGVRAEAGPLSVILAPQVTYTRNRDFRVVASEVPGRSAFSHPWHPASRSIDLPPRFGNQSLTVLDPGQSSLSLHARGLEVGVSTENQWWGPGIRNAIVMSNQAAGIPSAFARTERPLSTPLGEVEAKWMAGGLTESIYFDTITSNDARALSAAAVTLRPRLQRNLTVGAARAVYARTASARSVAGHASDVFTRWSGTTADSVPTAPDEDWEQILSLFGRWIFPADGLEVYGEWARTDLPGSFRDFLVAPNHSQGYTLGLQWVRPLGGADRLVRLQTELTYLEQSTTFRNRPVESYYVSDTVAQGYTQRGQSIGAAIGPGASGQWLALDRLAPTWQAGIFAGRIRWDNDAYYLQPTGFGSASHDVSMLVGVRASARYRGFIAAAELTGMHRYNFLFENLGGGFGPDGTFDVRSRGLSLTLSHAAPLLRLGRAR